MRMPMIELIKKDVSKFFNFLDYDMMFQKMIKFVTLILNRIIATVMMHF